MSIILYSGVPGSGKSLHATQMILDYLKMGKDVVSNYPVTFTKREIKKGYEERFQYVPDENLTNRFLLQNSLLNEYTKKRKEKQCLLVIDECAQIFNCRDFGDKDRRKWLDFFRIHRKLGYEVILVAQQDKMIDKQIRGVIQHEYHHRKGAHIVWWFALLPIQIHVAKQYFYGMVPKQALGADWFRYRKTLGKRYDTYALFDALDGSLIEETEKERNNRMMLKMAGTPPGTVRGRGSLASRGWSRILDIVSLFSPKGGKEIGKTAECLPDEVQGELIQISEKQRPARQEGNNQEYGRDTKRIQNVKQHKPSKRNNSRVRSM